MFDEVVSDLVKVDVHYVKPTEQRPFQTLITSGMSDRPMAPPPDCSEYAYAELMICLPPDWPLTDSALGDPNYSWPLEWIKLLALQVELLQF